MFGNKKAKTKTKTKAKTLASRFNFGSSKKKPPTPQIDYSLLEKPCADPEGTDVATELKRLSVENDSKGAPKEVAAAVTRTPNLNSSTLSAEDTTEGWSTPATRKQARQPSTAAPRANRVPVPPIPTAFESKNWRDRGLQGQAAREGACTLKTTRTAKTRGSFMPTGFCTPQSCVPHANLDKGTIVWRPDTRMNKGRYWIIVDRTNKTVWDIPIYTNHGTGLKLVPRKDRMQYYSVRPPDISKADFQNQSETHQDVSIDWVDGMEKDKQLDGKPMSTKMVANFSEVFKHSIDDEPVRIFATIAEEDTAFVVRKSEKFVLK
ncbi:hypothetical protein LTR97_004730 [Elasticomyces elasticus]|uniref:Uncharacterized protein n=1 Tax=Elasticomyces elasticus TaxID=574655 RepID=A0AAN7W7T3_9PEZI|nr:hypothetical protein LTR97_004730 [Elasticomyces elasticus]